MVLNLLAAVFAAVALPVTTPTQPQSHDTVSVPQPISIELFYSSEARSQLDQARVREAFAVVRSELGAAQRPLPRVIVLFASRSAVSLEGLPADARISVVRMNFRSLPLYHIWIIGDPKEAKVTYGLIRVLNREWELAMTEDQMDTLLDRVSRRMATTVSIKKMSK